MKTKRTALTVKLTGRLHVLPVGSPCPCPHPGLSVHLQTLSKIVIDLNLRCSKFYAMDIKVILPGEIPLPTSCASHCQLASSPLYPLRALQQLLRCDTAQTWWCKQSQIYLSSSCPEIFTRSNRRYSALPSRWLRWQTCACPTWGDQIEVVAIFTLMKMVQLLPCANTGLQAKGEFW